MSRSTTIKVDILAEVSKATQGIGTVNNNLTKLQKVAASGRSVLKGAMAADVLSKGADLVADTVKDAWATVKQQQKLGSQTASVLKSTGSAAGIGAQGIADLADELEGKSTIDKDAIHSGENLLLTFTNIKNQAGAGNDIFTQTTQIMTDMSTAMGQSTKTSAMQLGKALNDPVKGLSALSRVGVSFTAQQKDQVKAMVATGDTAGAQKIILAELNKEFGGSAEAASNTAQGAWFHAKDAIDDFMADVVRKALPTVTQLVRWFADRLPGALDTVSDGLATAERWLAPVVDDMKGFVGFMQRNPAAVRAFATTIGILGGAIGLVTIAQWAWNAALTANPIGLIVVGIAALVAAGVLLWTNTAQLRARFVTAWDSMWTTVGHGIDTAVGWFTGLPGRAWNALSTLTGKVKERGTDALTSMGTSVSTGTTRVIRWFTGLPGRAWNALSTLGSRLKRRATDALNSMFDASNWGIGDVINLFLGVPGLILNALHIDLYTAGRNIMIGLWNGLVSMWGQLTNFVSGIGPWIADHKGPLSYDARLLVPAGNAIMGGLISALQNNIPTLGSTLDQVTGSILGLNDITIDPTIKAAASSTAGRTAQGLTVTINVQAGPGTDKVALGRELAQTIGSYVRAGGQLAW